MFYIFNTHNDKITLTTVKILIDIYMKVLFIIEKQPRKFYDYVTWLHAWTEQRSLTHQCYLKGLSPVLFESSI